MIEVEREIPYLETQVNSGVYLTPRETDVIRLKAFGLSRKEIAKSLGISIQTVANHIRNATLRTGSYCTLETVLTAVDAGLISKDELTERFDFGRYSLLTQREREILYSTSTNPGDCCKEAAYRGEIAISTYRNKMNSIYSKLNVRGVGQAILYRRLLPQS